MPKSTKSTGKKRRTRGPDKKPRKTGSGVGQRPPRSKGRPPGIVEVLPRGAVAAIRALRHRVPEGIDDGLAGLAQDAFDTIVKVMDGKIRGGVKERLTASRLVRDEICGPVPKTVEHQGSVTLVVATGIDRTPGDPVAADRLPDSECDPEDGDA